MDEYLMRMAYTPVVKVVQFLISKCRSVFRMVRPDVVVTLISRSSMIMGFDSVPFPFHPFEDVWFSRSLSPLINIGLKAIDGSELIVIETSSDPDINGTVIA